MDLTIALEHRFERTPDGAVWTATGLARTSWSRYLGTFRRVRILARVRDVPAAEARWGRVDGEGVEVAPVPYYVGPGQYLLRRRAVARAVAAALARHADDAVILRVPGTLGAVAGHALRAVGRPYGVEVVGDPADVFTAGSVDHPLRAFFRWWATRELRALCAAASTSLYVTATALQRRYPPGGVAFAASDVELAEEAFAADPRGEEAPAGPPFRILFVGTLAALYKAPDVLLNAFARCCAEGLDAELVLVGDGRQRPGLEALARRLGVAGRVRFAGQLLSGAAVRRELDAAHLYVLPSRAEGLPRALAEAMARGLPCLATAVGGIPELLPADELVPRDPAAIAARIREIAASAPLRADLSRRNLERARALDERRLQPIREAFHRHLAAASAHGARAPGPARGLEAGRTVGA